MRKVRRVAMGVLALGVWLMSAGTAPAAPGPAWQLSLTSVPTHLAPGTVGEFTFAPEYLVVATNVGAGDAAGPVVLEATLPTGVTPIDAGGEGCDAVSGQTVTCAAAGPVGSSKRAVLEIPVEVSSGLSSGEVLADATAKVESPGAVTVTASTPTLIDTAPPPFGFLEGSGGLDTLFTKEDGTATLAAGTHPHQFMLELGFPIDQPSGPPNPTTNAGHPRDIVTDLPAGVVIDPNASARCTEAELLSSGGFEGGCPAEAQIGTVTVVTDLAGGPQPVPSALYNMVPPPGAAAGVAFNAAGAGVFVHLSGGVRSEGDFGIYAESSDTLALGTIPLERVQAQLQGDWTGLTMPSACSDRLTTMAHARSWEESELGIEKLEHHTSADAATVDGIPTEVTECSALKFEPTLTMRPDTNAAGSPSGFEIELEIPQSDSEDERATSAVRDVTVKFPQGVALNPAAADGLAACTPAQIGMITGVGQTPPHFDRNRPQCPKASKIGTVEVSTPLLDHTLPGAVYVAAPYQNPFGTLLGAYVVIDSPEDGIAVKLAGKTEADPNTGQLTVSFTDNPQLPVASFKVDLFGGARAALRTPVTCDSNPATAAQDPFTTTSLQAPWSGTPHVQTTDSFQLIRGPPGRPCVSSEAEMPNSPGFEAGTATPVAGNYSPFLGRLTREDGEQQLKSFSATLPPGLTGKLAGVGSCSDAAIATAKAKTGQQELASPSCPASSFIGTVQAGAGAGPTPYYTSGKIYMAGPFKGAPLSAVAITPAVAGPFDLGNVVIRVPTYLDPVTAVLSVKGGEEFPHILQGIPLELRDARISLDRNQFTLNPTSCKERAITGQAVSLLGSTALLFERFQVGGCRGLDYAPKLSIRLFGKTNRGAHPRLRAILTARPGEEANTARASVALPRSEFLENAHIQTVCTRVQFAADNCPAGAIYGNATAITPLLDQPLEGPVYLRSSNNELPDMVAALKGPPSRPIEVELVGRIDSVNGGIRSTFDFVPDQPVTKFILNMKGGRKGLIINSRDICAHTYRARAKFDGQNGKAHDFAPKLKASCKGKAKGKGRRR